MTGKDGNVGNRRLQIKGRIGVGVKVIRTKPACARISRKLPKGLKEAGFALTRKYRVCASMSYSMLIAKGSINSSQHHGHFGQHLPNDLNKSNYSRIPVSHQGGHKDHLRPRAVVDGLAHQCFRYAVSAIIPGHIR